MPRATPSSGPTKTNSAKSGTNSPLIDPDQTPRGAFVLDASHGPSEGRWHSHRRAQLVHAAEGVIVVRTRAGRWVAPPERAIWIPPSEPHSVSSRQPFRLLTLYVEAQLAPLACDRCCVVAVDRLVQELLEAAHGFGGDYRVGGPEERLIQVILDRLPVLAVNPVLHLPTPVTPELKRIARSLSQAPADSTTLEQWARRVGLTERTLARRFLAETGIPFGRYRRQLRLLSALERLGAGESVTNVALEVGYQDVSSFIHAFKLALGTTPARYFSSTLRGTSLDS